MSLPVSTRMLWALAAVLLFAVALILLRACDLQALPLFARKYCTASRSSALPAEAERHTQLQELLRLAELRYAERPLCQPTTNPTPPQTLTPRPIETPQPQPSPSPDQRLKVPTKLSDLRGCWESVRGDLPIVTDDAQARPVGDLRKCFCFGADGQGQLKLLYTNGVRCRAPMAAGLQDGTLHMSYPRFTCVVGGKEWGLVPEQIDCKNDASNDAASCDWVDMGRRRASGADQYRRVEQDHCGG